MKTVKQKCHSLQEYHSYGNEMQQLNVASTGGLARPSSEPGTEKRLKQDTIDGYGANVSQGVQPPYMRRDSMLI